MSLPNNFQIALEILEQNEDALVRRVTNDIVDILAKGGWYGTANDAPKSIHFSSKTDEWATPDDFFAKVVEEFGPFDVDVCATPENAKAPRYFTREQDGLIQEWGGKVWMNPPYGREIWRWMEMAMLQTKGLNGKADQVVCLVPARTDTRWWHEYVSKADEVRFIRGRLKFGGSKNSAPFPSALVVYRKAV